MELKKTVSDHLLVRACRGEAVERTPVWAMRQAGRWDPEFRKLRGDMGFFEFSENAELAAAASLCPLRFGVDAIILFYDITTLAIAMGQEFDLVPERGPVPRRPIRSQADVDQLATRPDPERFAAVLETLRIVKRELGDSLPVLVFAGAPFTLATYQISTGKNLAQTRAFIHAQADVWSGLLEKTATATIGFLRELLNAGAAAYQLFDSWAGSLTAEEYRAFAQPYHERIFREVGGLSILFVKDCPHEDLMAASGARVVSLGKMHSLRGFLERFPGLVVQGNVDHLALVHESRQVVQAVTEQCLREGGGRRHILNLDHGMDREARVENFAVFVDAARFR